MEMSFMNFKVIVINMFKKIHGKWKFSDEN